MEARVCERCSTTVFRGDIGQYEFGYHKMTQDSSTEWTAIGCPTTITTRHFEIPVGAGEVFLCEPCIRRKMKKPALSLLLVGIACVLPFAAFLFLPALEDAAPGWKILVALGLLCIGGFYFLYYGLRNLFLNRFPSPQYREAQIDDLAVECVRAGLRELHEGREPEPGYRFQVEPVRLWMD